MKPLCVLCDTFQHQQLLAWHLHLSKTFLLRTSTSLATIFAVAGWFGAALRFDSQSRSFRHRMAPKLIYFALPGRAEVARLMFSISGKQFEVCDCAGVLGTRPAQQYCSVLVTSPC